MEEAVTEILNMKDFEICLVGTPEGFECLPLFGDLEYAVQRMLDLDTPRLGLDDFFLLRAFEKVIDGSTYQVIGVYSNAYEIKLQRGGGFIGTVFLYKDCWQSNPSEIIPVLTSIHSTFRGLALRGGNKFWRNLISLRSEVQIPSLGAFKLSRRNANHIRRSSIRRDLVLSVGGDSRIQSFDHGLELIFDYDLVEWVGNIYALDRPQTHIEKLCASADFISLPELKAEIKTSIQGLLKRNEHLEQRCGALEVSRRELAAQVDQLTAALNSRQVVKDMDVGSIGLALEGASSIKLTANLTETDHSAGSKVRPESPTVLSQKRVSTTPSPETHQPRLVKRSVTSLDDDDSTGFGWWAIVGLFTLVVVGVVGLIFQEEIIQILNRGKSPPNTALSSRETIARKPVSQPDVIESKTVCKPPPSQRAKITFVNTRYQTVGDVASEFILQCFHFKGCESQIEQEFIDRNGLKTTSLEIGQTYTIEGTDLCVFPKDVFPAKPAPR